MDRSKYWLLLLLLLPATLFAQPRSGRGYELIRNFDILEVRSTPPALPDGGDQYLVGFQPTGLWSANENDIARWDGAAWVFVAPGPGDQSFDASGRQYLFTGVATLFDGLWLDSRWRELTPFMAKWKAGGVIGGSYTVSAEDHSTWLVVNPAGPDVTVTLPAPFLPPISGMRFLLELDCSTAQTISVVVADGGILQHPDGSQTVAAFDFDASACSNDSFVYELVAGNTTTRAQWYITPRQVSAAP